MTLDAMGLAVLAAGGFAAGVVNTMAGGGSLLTVPLLVTLGLPGTVANATNRIGVLVQSLAGVRRFRAEGVAAGPGAAPVLLPLLAGSGAGALVVSRLSDRLFEQLFGIVMLVLLVPLLRPGAWQAPSPSTTRWSPAVSAVAFFTIGFYGGAVQVGVGLFLLLTLARAGHDLVASNVTKNVAIAAFTAIAALIFALNGQVRWVPAAVLSVGMALGADVGARLAVGGGERLVRAVVIVAVLALAGRMLGFY